MLHKVQVVTTVSTFAASSGMFSAELWMNGRLSLRGGTTRQGEQLWRWFEADDLSHGGPVERQIEPGADATSSTVPSPAGTTRPRYSATLLRRIARLISSGTIWS